MSEGNTLNRWEWWKGLEKGRESAVKVQLGYNHHQTSLIFFAQFHGQAYTHTYSFKTKRKITLISKGRVVGWNKG